MGVVSEFVGVADPLAKITKGLWRDSVSPPLRTLLSSFVVPPREVHVASPFRLVWLWLSRMGRVVDDQRRRRRD